jgi:nucleotide-binding universal stress UspA family protein
MFKRILFATDGSEHAMKAADTALELAKTNHAQVEILYVCYSVNTWTRVVYSADSLRKELKEEAEEILSQVVAKFKKAGIPYTTKVLTGDIADVICHEAERNKIKLIVMGSRGLNTVSSFVLGSVSSKVLSHACCPVLIVR